MKLNDYGHASGAKCGALQLIALMDNSHDFPGTLTLTLTLTRP